MSELPPGWVECELDDIVLDVSYGYTAKSNPSGGSARMLRITDIQNNKVDWLKVPFCDITPPEKEKYLLQKWDLVFTRTGATVGKSFLIRDDVRDSVFASYLIRVRTFQSDIVKYLSHFFDSPIYWNQITEFSSGIGQPNVNGSKLKNLRVPLAPLPEQKRIADKLDAVLAQVDACRERLDRVPHILRRFRQSILTAATSGKLTEEWRQDRQRPNEWELVHLTDVGELGRGKSKHRPRNDPALYGGVYPFIQTGDIAQSRGRITQHSQTYNDFGLAQSKLWPAGTLCITIAANIADTAILTYPACFPDSVVGFVAVPAKSIPEFVKWSIDVISDRLESFAPATAQKNINLAVLNDVEFQCPQVDEQAEIVRRVEALFAFADRLEARYTVARAQVEHLTPALLAKAFRGELAPQDPNDEPASVLLERIRAARAVTEEAGAKPRQRKARVKSVHKSGKEDLMLEINQVQPDHLTAILKEQGRLSPKTLWQASQLGIEDFYEQLRAEEEKRLLREVRDGADCFLEAA